MNQEIKAKWVAALRSGQYKQGKECLRNEENHFCCLGVLCDIIDNTKWRPNNMPDKPFKYGVVGDSDHNYLPTYIARKAELLRNQEVDLSLMNDRGNSFERIAKHIEDNF